MPIRNCSLWPECHISHAVVVTSLILENDVRGGDFVMWGNQERVKYLCPEQSLPYNHTGFAGVCGCFHAVMVVASMPRIPQQNSVLLDIHWKTCDIPCHTHPKKWGSGDEECEPCSSFCDCDKML